MLALRREHKQVFPEFLDTFLARWHGLAKNTWPPSFMRRDSLSKTGDATEFRHSSQDSPSGGAALAEYIRRHHPSELMESVRNHPSVHQRTSIDIGLISVPESA
jgi:hypothetical protein